MATYLAHYINPKTGSETEQFIVKANEEKALKEALRIKMPYQEFVRLEAYAIRKTSVVKTDTAKHKLIQDLQDYFGGKKYNVISEDITLRIADHSKNPVNDGRYNYDSRVISFVVPAFGGEFTGYNANEYNLDGLTKAQAIKLIKSKI